METYKSYKKINEPYFSLSESVAFPGLIVLATMIITYFSLYFAGPRSEIGNALNNNRHSVDAWLHSFSLKLSHVKLQLFN